MIDKMSYILKDRYNIILDEFAIFEVEEKSNFLYKIGIICFILFTTLLLVMNFVLHIEVNIIYFIYVTFVFFMIPRVLFRGETYKALLVTEKALIQRTSKESFSVVRFDNITDFKIDEKGVTLREGNAMVRLSLKMPRSQMEPIIDILEAKGKTFEVEKAYLVRPISISFKHNKIMITDISQEETRDEMYSQFVGKYEYLTPGYLEEVILFDSIVTTLLKGTNYIEMKLTKFTVKDGHPENVTFDPLDIKDGCIIFGKARIQKILYLVYDGEDAEIEELNPTFDNLKINIEKGIISDWTVGFNNINIEFAVGVHKLKTTIAFESIIVGWNLTVEREF